MAAQNVSLQLTIERSKNSGAFDLRAFDKVAEEILRKPPNEAKAILDKLAVDAPEMASALAKIMFVVAQDNSPIKQAAQEVLTEAEAARVKEMIFNITYSPRDPSVAAWAKNQLVVLASDEHRKNRVVEQVIGGMARHRCAYNLWALRALGDMKPWCASPTRRQMVNDAISTCGKDETPMKQAYEKANIASQSKADCGT